jgi:teichuronic acid biosynthesis glycosyltransferase TuaG
MVSIIMAAFNAEKYISEAIESVLMQSYTNWELIVVDDGSSDNTIKLIEGFADKRINLIKLGFNRGVSFARNEGLRRCKGEYVCFLDSDDALPVDSVKLRVELLESGSCDFADGIWIECDKEMSPNGVIRIPRYKGRWLPRLVRLDQRAFIGISVMMKRKRIGKTMFRTDITHGEDLLFYMSIANEGEYDSCQAPVLFYRTGHNSAMSNVGKVYHDYGKIFRHVQSGSRYYSLLFLIKIAKFIVGESLKGSNLAIGIQHGRHFIKGTMR